MISAKCYTQEWIEKKSQELGCHDKNLIEKVIHAFRFSTCWLDRVVLSISRAERALNAFFWHINDNLPNDTCFLAFQKILSYFLSIRPQIAKGKNIVEGSWSHR